MPIFRGKNMIDLRGKYYETKVIKEYHKYHQKRGKIEVSQW